MYRNIHIWKKYMLYTKIPLGSYFMCNWSLTKSYTSVIELHFFYFPLFFLPPSLILLPVYHISFSPQHPQIDIDYIKQAVSKITLMFGNNSKISLY